MNTILAVDANADVHRWQTAEWVKYDIDTIRVNTISEAAARLAREEFLFIAVNEDSIPDLMSQLRSVRDMTNSPIFVLSSNYTIDKKIQAMSCGADVYDAFAAYRKADVLAALELLRNSNGRGARGLKPPAKIEFGDIALLPPQRRVFVKGIETVLTKKEFDILWLLMSNRGCVVTHAQFLNTVWGGGYVMGDVSLLWRTVDRLRKKLGFPGREYIKIERGAGYKFVA